MWKSFKPNTAIRIKKKGYAKDGQGNPITTDASGHPIQPAYLDIIDEDILVEWQNKFGDEAIQAAANQAVEPASLRLWYLPGVTADCRIVRVEDNAEFEIIGTPDDVKNQHQMLEIQVKRYTGG